MVAPAVYDELQQASVNLLIRLFIIAFCILTRFTG
jgi:hypothetical protein